MNSFPTINAKNCRVTPVRDCGGAAGFATVPAMTAEIVPATATAIGRAAALLLAGRLVAFPTETVYGLGGDASDDRAVAAIFAAKGRPRFNPLIVHVAGLAEAEALAVFDERARAAAARFWPGPLSLVLPRRRDSGLSLLASAGLDTVALRAPAHPVAQALLRAAERPVAAPSANRSGRVSPTEAAHVAIELGDAVALILDGGRSPVGPRCPRRQRRRRPRSLPRLRRGQCRLAHVLPVVRRPAHRDGSPPGIDRARGSPAGPPPRATPDRPSRRPTTRPHVDGP